MRKGIHLRLKSDDGATRIHGGSHIHVGAEFLADEAAGELGGEEGQEEDLVPSTSARAMQNGPPHHRQRGNSLFGHS